VRTATLAVVLAAAFLTATATAGARASRPDHTAAFVCPGPHRRLIAADADAVVYRTPPESQALGEEYACAYAGKRAFLVGPPPYGSASGSGGVSPIALAGPVAAYADGYSGSQGHSVEEVWVRNLATGRLLYRMPNGSPAEPGDVGLGGTTAIVVKSDGSVAWIVRAGSELGGIQVRSVDASGSHLLAVSPAIEPDSLAGGQHAVLDAGRQAAVRDAGLMHSKAS
jgi:hypothetical protein